jgi:transposase
MCRSRRPRVLGGRCRQRRGRVPRRRLRRHRLEQLRARLRHRIQLVRLRTLLRNRVHAVLADHGHDRAQGCWSGPGRAWLAGLELPEASREVIEDCLAMIDAIQAPIERLDVEVHQHARADPRVRVLTALPGVGEADRAGDRGRDRRHRPVRFGAQAGRLGRAHPDRARLGPGRAARAHLQAGLDLAPSSLGWILCEAAQTAKRSPEFAATYQAICRRRGKKIATTAVARKLLTRAYHLLAARAGSLPWAPSGPRPAPVSGGWMAKPRR